MTSTSSTDLASLTPDTRAAFVQYLRDNPNDRRVSQADQEILIEWLTNPHKRPSTQKEFSRRNYVRKTFVWNEKTGRLFVAAKTGGDKDRTVVTEDMIATVVEFVHEGNGHAGWDATWKDVSNKYYGILRTDVIFLLKRCQVCASNPSKRPKGSAATMSGSQPVDQEAVDFIGTSGLQYNISTLDVSGDNKCQGE